MALRRVGGNPLRLLALALSTLVLAAALAAAAPAATAFTWCTSATNPVKADQCQHLVCVGRSTSTSHGYTRERCSLSEDDLPDCGPACDRHPVLP